jgi:DNA (cytosine-5)-methyltransferase 1
MDAGVDLRHGWANDYDADSVRTYLANIEGALPDSVICGDVRHLDVASLPPITGFAFGFPCNDFSIVGKKLGVEGNFGPLYKYGVNVLETHNPDWFVAENVGGIRSSNQGEAFIQILSELIVAGSDGYSITPHLYKFEQYGVPQSRHRVFIVGIKNSLGLNFRPPSPKPYENVDVSVRTALTRPLIAPDAPNNEKTRQSDHVVERLKLIAPGRNAFNSDLPAELALNVAGAKLSQIYKRLDPSKPSYTVTGSGGGGTHVYHWAEPRALTNRERARIQTFPDDFEFVGKKESVRKQIGMAVPVEGARAIFNSLFQQLNGKETQTIPANLPQFLERAKSLLERLPL